MSQSLVFPSTFNSKNIAITAPRMLQSGAKQAYLNYSNGRLVMQTAVSMTVPFGLNVADKFGPPEYSVDVSFRGSEQRDEIKEFMNVISVIDDTLIEEGVKNSKKWFKDDLSYDVIKKFYTPSLKYSKDKEGNVLNYPPNLKLKLRKINNEFETKFYDINGNPYKNTPIEDLLVKGVQITAIIECAGVWFAGSKFGLTWRAKQIAIHALPEKIGEFAFKGLSSKAKPELEDDEVDDDAVFGVQKYSPVPSSSTSSLVAEMMLSKQPEHADTTETAESAEQVDDEQGDDIEPVPAPKKTIIKKKVITKAK